MSSDVPLKIANTDGDLQKFTVAEEQYLSYQMGLQLAEAVVGDTWALDNASGGRAIGTYSNTFYEQPVGTHPGAALSVGTITTTLYQGTGPASEINSGIRRPLRWNPDNTSLKEMTSSEYDTFVTRILEFAVANDYPGTYTLANSLPSANHDVHLSNVFSDTRADGTVVTFNVYKKVSLPSVPAKRNSVCVKREGGKTGTYQGVSAMTDGEMKLSFGQRAKTIAAEENAIGSYILLNSSQVPTDVVGITGTWVSKGTATDTRNVTEQSSFTQNYLQSYQQDYVKDYVGQYNRDYIGSYGSTVDKTYAAAYAGFASFGNVLPTTDPTTFTTTDATSFANVLPTTDATILATSDPTVFADVQPTTEATILATTDATSFANVLPTVFADVQPTVLPTSFFVTDFTTFTVSDPTILATTDPTVLPGTDFTNFFVPGTDFTQFPGTEPTILPTQFFAFFGPPLEPFQSTIPGTDPTTLPTLGGESQPTTFTLGTFQPTTTPAVQPTTDPTVLPTGFSTNWPTVIGGSDPTTDPTSFTVTEPTSFGNVLPTTDPTVLATTDPTTFATIQASTDPTILATTDATSFANVLPTVFADVLATTDPTSYLSPSNYVKSYTGSYTRQYVGDYILQVDESYSATYVKLYSKAYAQQYVGTTLTATTTGIETYTLYVKIAA